MPDVYLYNIDDLQSIADQSMQQRKEEMVRCEEIIREKAAILLGHPEGRDKGVRAQTGALFGAWHGSALFLGSRGDRFLAIVGLYERSRMVWGCGLFHFRRRRGPLFTRDEGIAGREKFCLFSQGRLPKYS